MTKDQLIAENAKLAKTIKQYEEAMPALVKENEELRAEVQERTNFETAIKDDNNRLRAVMDGIDDDILKQQDFYYNKYKPQQNA